MPQIRQYQAEESARRAGTLSAEASPAAFGAGIGRAISGLGGDVSRLSVVMSTASQDRRDKKEQIEAQIKLANATSEAAIMFQKAQTEAAPDGADFASDYLTQFDGMRENVLGSASSDQQRDVLSVGFARLRARFAPDAVVWEAGRQATWMRDETKASLGALRNTVIADPSRYDMVVEQGGALIDSLPGAVDSEGREGRVDLKQSFVQDVSRDYFDTKVRNAETAETVRAIRAELAGKQWKDRLTPQSYASVTEQLLNRERAIEQGTVQVVRSHMDNTIDRMTAGFEVAEAEIANISGQVAEHGDTAMVAKWGAALAKRDWGRAYKGQPPAVLQSEIDAVRSADGNIPGSFVERVVQVESGGNRNAKASTSNAVGLGQFIPATWESFIRERHPKLIAQGDIQKFRTDPALSKEAIAWYAESNADYLSARRLPVTEGTLYLAHFLGPEGAAAMLRADPNASAASINRKAANANQAVFFGRGDQPKTVAEIVAWADGKMGVGGGTNDLARFQAAKEQLERATKGLDDDPLKFAMEDNPGMFGVEVNTQTGEGLGDRMSAVDRARRYYDVPDMPMLTDKEVADIGRMIAEQSSQQKAEFSAGVIDELGPRAPEFFKLFEDEEPLFSWSGSLMANNPEHHSTAVDVLRGQEVLAARKLTPKQYYDDLDADDRMPSEVTAALGNFPEKLRAAQDAADNLYAWRIRNTGEFTDEGYRLALRDVLGGSAVEAINGSPTLLPKGVSGDDFEDALEAMTPEDLKRLSVGGGMPVYISPADGRFTPLTPEDLADQGEFEAVGPNIYAIRIGDGYALDSLGIASRGSNINSARYRIQLNHGGVMGLRGRAFAAEQLGTDATRNMNLEDLPQ